MKGKCEHEKKSGLHFNPFGECNKSEKEACEKKIPFEEVFKKKSNNEAIGTSALPQLARGGVKK